MKKIMFLLVMLSLQTTAHPQDYDLIILSSGDSIVCHIDSITDSKVFLAMKYKNKWIKTHYNLDKITDYKTGFYRKEELLFIGDRPKLLNPEFEGNRFLSYHRNTFTVESNIAFSSIRYCHLWPRQNNNWLSAGAGINYFAFGDWWASLESTFLIGKGKHYFEVGAELFLPMEDIPGATIVGYRFQGNNGLVLKANLHLIFPMFAIGFTF
uniref:hypothetical protein n=1 Tax=uncultured Draconibacterium sp. TaxID=1573823 RepID=UPI0032170B2C